jgi:FtsH-binding integral membrane protein
MDFLKTIGGKVVTGLMAIAVIAAAISWWEMDASTKDKLLSGTGKILGWFGIVIALPWASFFLIGRVAKLESNAAGGAFVALLTALEAVLLAWLFNWAVKGAMPWTFFAAATLLAAVYNLFTCDWIAEKVSS